MMTSWSPSTSSKNKALALNLGQQQRDEDQKNLVGKITRKKSIRNAKMTLKVGVVDLDEEIDKDDEELNKKLLEDQQMMLEEFEKAKYKPSSADSFKHSKSNRTQKVKLKRRGGNINGLGLKITLVRRPGWPQVMRH
ncbi:hypothetical protein L6452_36034 [Arctium lappa]|uniref:Uncharacterized protein n=1 Tax=Arctium lappa TaxID=4217 RepID=A0ACB8Y7G0_ARCLA|nr:hypothetical protein L6452_36034 [Arctium lappa]